MYVLSRVNLKTCHFVLTYLKLNIQTVVYQFQIGTVADSHYLKSGIFCTWLSLPMFLGSHRSCSPVLTYKGIALSIAFPLSHIYWLAFAGSKNLFIANFEGHIIKFGRFTICWRKMSTVEYYCESLNIKTSPIEYKSKPFNINISTVEYKCESWNVKMSTVEYKREPMNMNMSTSECKCESLNVNVNLWTCESLNINVNLDSTILLLNVKQSVF